MQGTGFKNYYCDPLASFIYEGMPRTNLEEVTVSKEEEKLLCEYAVIKNKVAGVSEVNIACSEPSIVLELLKKYGLKGRAVVSDISKCSDGTIFHIKDILSLSEQQLQDIALEVGKRKIPCMLTFGRTLDQMGQIDKLYGMSPARFLEEEGFLDRECLILGGNYLDKDDLNILSQYDARVVVTPRSDMLLGRGFINLSPLKSQGLALGFATDIHPYTDMLAEVYLAAGQTANLMHDAKAVQFEELLKFLYDGSPPAMEVNLELQALTGVYMVYDEELEERSVQLFNKLIPLINRLQK